MEELLAKQVHDYFANDYVPRSDHLVEDIKNYCYQLPSIAGFHCRGDFRSFLCYLAAKTIILMASGIRTQFKTFYYQKDGYIQMQSNYSRADNSVNELFKRDEISDMVNMIESLHNEGIERVERVERIELPYETIIHRLYPLIKNKYHVMGHARIGQIGWVPNDATIVWEYTYNVTLEYETTRKRQMKLFKQAMMELEYSPPVPGLLPKGGIQYQKGLERFNSLYGG